MHYVLYDGKQYDKCEDIDIISNDDLLFNFKNIILSYIKDNLDNHLKINEGATTYKNRIEKNPNPDWLIMRIPAIRGHGTYEDPANDFFTIISNDKKEDYKNLGLYKNIVNLKDKLGNSILKYYFAFNTKQELYNFYNYIRTDFFRGLYMCYKNSNNVFKGSEFTHLPWFNFSDNIFDNEPNILDDYLFNKFKLSNELRQHIENILPDYYNIRKG